MAQSDEFQIYVDFKDVAHAALDLSQIEGITIRLPTKELPAPDTSKKHGSYSLSFDQLAPLIISLSGATTGLLSLATALFQLKTAKAKDGQSTEKSDRSIVIHVQNDVIPLEKFGTPHVLVNYLAEKFGDRRESQGDR